MTTSDFYKKVEEYLKEEQDAGNNYAMLAKEAINEEDRRELLMMARQEIMHRARLEGMLLEWKTR